MRSLRGLPYCGIDPSLRATGVAVVKNSVCIATLLIKPRVKLSDGERLAVIFDAVLGALKLYTPALAVIEGYSMMSVHRPFALGEAAGAAKLAAAKAGVLLHIAAPSQLKKFVTGNGSATKEHVRRCLVNMNVASQASLDSLDISDATGLALIAEAVHTESSPRGRRCEAEVIKAVLTPKKKKKRGRGPRGLVNL